MADFDCPLCGSHFTNSYPYKLLIHGGNVHLNEPDRPLQCLEPGCESHAPVLLPPMRILQHFCEHLRFRTRVQTYSSEDTPRQPTSLEVEEELAAEVPLDDWLLDSSPSDEVFQGQFSTPAPPWDEETKARFRFLWIELKNSFTTKAHSHLVTFLKDYGFPIQLASSPKTLKEEAWRYFSSIGLGVDNIAKRTSEPLPYFGLKKTIRAWMLHPVLSEVMVRVSDERTLPFVLLDHAPVNETKRHMADGSEWLEPFFRTKNDWLPAFATADRVVFLHLLQFADGIPFWTRHQKGYEVFSITLGEFDEGLRSSVTSPAIFLNLMASKDQQQKEFPEYDSIFSLFTEELRELIRGVSFYCAHLDKVVTVIAVFHGMEADLPERCKTTGFKNPNNCQGQYCPVCETVKEDLAAELNSGIVPRLRDPEAFFTKVQQIRSLPEEMLKTAMLAQNGLSRISALWDYPGARLTRQALLELMHLEAEGELLKHFQQFSTVLEERVLFFWTKLNSTTQAYFRQHGETFPIITSFESWSQHLNAHDRLRFCLHSRALLRGYFNDSVTDNHWVAWQVHVAMVTIAVRHSITLADCIQLGSLAARLQQWLLRLYGDITTPNSHWTQHLRLFVEWYGVLRGFWTFPQESLLSLAKKATKKMTNHKAVAFTCVRLFVLERLLDQFLYPESTIPKRNDVAGGTEVVAGDLAEVFALSPDALGLRDPSVTVNYQTISKGSYVRTSQGLFHLLTVYYVENNLFAQARRMLEVRKDTVTELPLLREDPPILLVDLSCLVSKIYTLFLSHDSLLLSYEDR